MEFLLVSMLWLPIFLIGAVPALGVGWVIGKIPVPTGLCVGFAFLITAAAGFALGNRLNPQYNSFLGQLMIWVPPLVPSVLVGLWISRGKKQPERRPWYLPPEQ